MENKTKQLTGRLPGLVGKALLTAVLAPALSLTGVLSGLPLAGEALMPLAPVMTVYAQTVVPDNPAGRTYGELQAGEYMDINYGTITLNNGEVDCNRGTVDDNSGTVGLNSVTINVNSKSGIVSSNSEYGTIEDNYGTINNNTGNYNDKGKVNTNHPGATIGFNGGNVIENAGTINQTGQFAVVTKNAATGEIKENYGTVTTNEGTVVKNRWMVTENNGTVNNVNSKATVDTNKGIVNLTDGKVNTNAASGIVNANGKGTVGTNEGTVNVSEGAQITISDNTNGTVNNFGGTVALATGQSAGSVVQYFSVELSAPSNASAGFTGFTQNQNKNWLAQTQTGTITLTPAAGYQINSVTSSAPGTTATKNADGTWTVTVKNINANIADSAFTIAVETEQAAPAPAPGNRNTPGSAQPVNPVFHLNLSDLFGDGSAQTMPQPQTATPNVAEAKQNFDSVYYADNNPDLYEAYGYDHDLLWNHYVTYGRQEGRKVRFVEGIHKGAVDEGKGKEDFDAIAYADYYADLFAVYGYDEDALWNHYDTVGRAEGRLYFSRQVS